MEPISDIREFISCWQFDLAGFLETAQRYERAKARLLAAQEEKMESTAELMASRTLLSEYLEAIWPGSVE